jgi:hypothetical protein
MGQSLHRKGDDLPVDQPINYTSGPITLPERVEAISGDRMAHAATIVANAARTAGIESELPISGLRIALSRRRRNVGQWLFSCDLCWLPCGTC